MIRCQNHNLTKNGIGEYMFSMFSTQKMIQEIKAEDDKKNDEQNYQLASLTDYGYWILGYMYEVTFKDPNKFITDHLYTIASQQGHAIAPLFSSILAKVVNVPQFLVLGPYDRDALQHLFQAGEKKYPYVNARDEVNKKVRAATGSKDEYIFTHHVQETAALERNKIKMGMNNVDEVFRVSQAFVNNISEAWRLDLSFQDNMRYITTNIMAICVFGIPHVPIEEMDTLERINHVLAYNDIDDPVFIAASQKLQKLSDELVDEYGDYIIKSNKFLASQLKVGEGVEKLRELKAGSSLLVENNLSLIVMHALAHIATNKIIMNKLRSELAESGIDFTKIPEHEGETILLNKQINDLSYLRKIYMEALRFVNPGVMTLRQTDRVTRWAIKDKEGVPHNITLNANSYLFAPLRMMGHDKSIWDEPEKFNPDRFVKDQQTFSQYGNYPFMLGNRSCPAGASFVRQVFNMVIAGIVQNFDFTLSGQMKPVPANSLHPILEPPLQIESYTRLNKSSGMRF
jgi:hypothetical protein